MKEEFIEAKTTSKGFVCLWEEYHPEESRAIIICKPGGSPAVATYLYKTADVEKNDHHQAIIPVHPGYLIFEGKLKDGKIDMVIKIITKTFEMLDGTPKVKVAEQNSCHAGVWAKEPFERYANPIKLMEKKLMSEYPGKVFSELKH